MGSGVVCAEIIERRSARFTLALAARVEERRGLLQGCGWLDGQGIARAMLFDLEAQEFVNSLDRVGVGRMDFDLSAELGAFGGVRNLLLKPLHGLHPRRVSRVNEHWHGKIAVAEHACD